MNFGMLIRPGKERGTLKLGHPKKIVDFLFGTEGVRFLLHCSLWNFFSRMRICPISYYVLSSVLYRVFMTLPLLFTQN